MRAAPLLLSGLLLGARPAPPSAPSDEAYHEGLAAYRKQDYRAAVARFEVARTQLAPDHPLYAAVHYNLGRCAELLVEREDDGEMACRGAEWFAVFLRNAGPDQTGALPRAQAGRDALAARCAAAQAPPPVAVVATPPPPPPPPPPSHALAWTLTGGALALAAGGTALVALSLQDEAQADRAYNHYQAAETAEEAERFAAEVRDAEDAAIPKNVGGLTLLGAGVALGALAVWAWTRDPGDEVALHVGPAVAGAGWRW